ncbi:hypothetical protein FACS1894201_09150 [Bacteroidia bacterium]|nr:hypothetical protein FACS1894201_09150 [Bacteroidia bacterium]
MQKLFTKIVLLTTVLLISNRVAQAQANEPEMVVVAGGTTVLNGTTVTMDNFHISKYEITQKQWYDVMGSWSPADAPSPQYGVGDDYPMYNVSYDDILIYIEKLNQLTGKDYRLPTEAEWEYAAKGGQSTNNYTYSGSNTIGEVAWYSANADNKTHVVGSKTANELGIYDMSGNVREWCSDRYGSQYPSDVINPVGASFDGSYFVIRGGGWNGDTANCAVTNRRNNSPSYRYPYVGFRIVCCSNNSINDPNDCICQSEVEIEIVTVEGGTTTLNGTEVFISTFQIGKYEVTQKQWCSVMGKWPVHAERPDTAHGKGDDYPMYGVSYDDIQNYITKLNQLTGKTYRLPTEAEWEYAAKGGQQTKDYTYSGSNTVDEVAWYSNNSNGTTHTVGKLKANELGLFDMSGNVLERCSDWYNENNTTYPSGNNNPTGVASGTAYVSRGGWWNVAAQKCSIKELVRFYGREGGNDLGFRLVLVP